MSGAAVIAGAATVLAMYQLVPQVLRLRRFPHAAGISASWVALGIVTNAAWFLYRSVHGLWLGVPSPAVAAALYGVTLWLLVAKNTPPRTAALVAIAGIGVLGSSGLVGGWASFGTILGFSGAVQAAPSVWAVFRVENPIAVAPGLWRIGVAQAALWGLFGWIEGDQALMLYGLTTVVAGVVVLVRCQRTRQAGTVPVEQLPAPAAA